MKAAVFEDVKKMVYYEDYPKPTPGPDDVIIKVHYCAICGTDVSNFKNKIYQTPLICGHEFSGEIVEVGENIKDFKVGDKAAGVSVYGPIKYVKMKAIGVMIDGAFAEYVRIPKHFLFHAPENVSPKECTAIETLAVVVRALKNAKIEKNQRIAIVGGGNIGLTTLLVLLSEWAPEYAIVIEPHEFLREKAKELGATEAFPPTKPKLNRFFKKMGEPTFIFECAGNEQALNLSFDIIERGGTIVLESVYKGNISIPTFVLNVKEVALKGTLSHDRDDILDAIELLAKKKVDVSPLLSEVIPLKDIQKAFERFLEPGERKFVKILIDIA